VSSLRQRQYVLAGLLVAVGLLTAAILWEVVGVVFFAVTVAYVLYPAREMLVDRGASPRVASGLVTTTAFLAVDLLFVPIVWTLVQRTDDIVSFVGTLPDTLPVEVAGFSYTVQVAEYTGDVTAVVRATAIDLAANSVFIVLQLAMFTLVLYGLLLRPNAVADAVYGIVPPDYHDVVRRINDRISDTLYALYVIQAATAVLTLPIALVVFYALGYQDVLVLSVLAAVLQFVPILGPGVLAVGLAGVDLVAGQTQRAVAVAVLGPALIGLLPDVVVRPQLASRQAKLPVSLYFVGFVGGVLTVGVVGIIAGPLVVAVFIEVVDLLNDVEPASTA